METPTRPPLRITVEELAPRSHSHSEEQLSQVLKRIGSLEGQPCQADCDCRIGLRCLDGRCIEA